MQTRGPITVLAGRYALEEELGRSGTGMAWRAVDDLLGRTVTVKLIHPSLGDDPAFTERLAREARRLAALAAPGVVRLLDSGVEDGVPFLVREHVEGTSASSRLHARGPLPFAEAVGIASGVLEALAPVHEAGILHLHLSLHHVLLTRDGGVRLTGLGIGPAVTATRSPAEATRLLAGGDLAPEQAAGSRVDHRTDVFGAGAILFELLTGETPGGRLSPRQVRPGVPRALDRAVARALAPEPGQRHEDAGAFAAALSVAADDAGDRGVRRGWLVAWLGVPIAIAAVAAGVIAAGLWLDRLEVGGPLGIRPATDEGSPSSTPPPATEIVRPVSVVVIDPYGDDNENDSGAPLASDGDRTTAWRSENYFDGRLNKPGVGLVFDVGSRRELVGFRLWTPHAGFVFHLAVGDDPEAVVEEIGEPYTADLETRGTLEGSGRYVLLWITTVVQVGDGIRAEVAEFQVVADADA